MLGVSGGGQQQEQQNEKKVSAQDLSTRSQKSSIQ
jgi:hypothetical protein